MRLLYVKSKISNPEAVPKPLGRELSRFTLNNANINLHHRLKLNQTKKSTPLGCYITKMQTNQAVLQIITVLTKLSTLNVLTFTVLVKY